MCEALRAWCMEDTGEVEPSYDCYPPVPLRFFSPEVKSTASHFCRCRQVTYLSSDDFSELVKYTVN